MQTSVTPARLHGQATHHIWVHTDITQQKVPPSHLSDTGAIGYWAQHIRGTLRTLRRAYRIWLHQT